MPTPRKTIQIAISLIIVILFAGISVSIAKTDTENHDPGKQLAPINTSGYYLLRVLLEDEQYLTSIRRAKMVLTFADISDSSSDLIDQIASSAEDAIIEMDRLSSEEPVINFDNIQENTLARATLDSIRLTTAKEFLLDSDNFEKNLLLSQNNALQLITHLAKQLEDIEPNVKRKQWLMALSRQFETYYQHVNSHIFVQTSKK